MTDHGPLPPRDSFAQASEQFYQASTAGTTRDTMHIVAYGLNIVSDYACGKIRPIGTFEHFRELVRAWHYDSPSAHDFRDRHMVAGMIDLVEGLLSPR